MRWIAFVALMIFTGLPCSLLSVAFACPFCPPQSATLTEKLETADAAALVRWVEGNLPNDDDPGSAVYEVITPVPGKTGDLRKATKVTTEPYRKGLKGQLYLLTGTIRDDKMVWDKPEEISHACFEYMVNAPAADTTLNKRLEYFLPYLEHEDTQIANDAYSEFGNTPYEFVKKASSNYDPKRIRTFLTDDKVQQSRRGLYGLMLGLNGRPEEAKLLRSIIVDPNTEYRLGINGVMGGYLLLEREKALDLLDRTKLTTRILVDADGKPILDATGKEQPLPFSETFAAMEALRFLWQHEPDLIPKERVRQSMRYLLDRPEMAELVIADLARWEDWSIMDRLMVMYDDKRFNEPLIKRSIVRFMLQSTKVDQDPDDDEVPPYVVAGKKNVETLRKKDPKLVALTERFFFPPEEPKSPSADDP